MFLFVSGAYSCFMGPKMKPVSIRDTSYLKARCITSGITSIGRHMTGGYPGVIQLFIYFDKYGYGGLLNDNFSFVSCEK